MATSKLEAELHRLHPHLRPNTPELLVDGELLPYQRQENGMPPEEAERDSLWLVPVAFLVALAVAIAAFMWVKSNV